MPIKGGAVNSDVRVQGVDPLNTYNNLTDPENRARRALRRARCAMHNGTESLAYGDGSG